MIYARKGEKVTCTNGHVICEFGRTVMVGEIEDAANYVNWRQPEPRRGDAIPRCAMCGARCFGMTSGVAHFRRGWRGEDYLLPPGARPDPIYYARKQWERGHRGFVSRPGFLWGMALFLLADFGLWLFSPEQRRRRC